MVSQLGVFHNVCVYSFLFSFQTWEDPNHTDPETGTKGDQDPLDVCEIGHKVFEDFESIKLCKQAQCTKLLCNVFHFTMFSY